MQVIGTEQSECLHVLEAAPARGARVVELLVASGRLARDRPPKLITEAAFLHKHNRMLVGDIVQCTAVTCTFIDVNQ